MGIENSLGLSRRHFCATTALSAFSLFPRAAAGEDVAPPSAPEISTYTVPRWKYDLLVSDLAKKPVAVSQTYASVPSGIYASTVHIGAKGDIFIRSFQNISDNGWFNNHIKFRAARPGKLTNPTAGDPGIIPTKGSGVMLEFVVKGEKRRFFLSNDHVIFGARRELEELSISSWKYDVNLFPESHARVEDNDRAKIPVVSICADPGVSNKTLSQRNVRIFGLGANLYNFEGKPFSFRASIPMEGARSEQIELFGLRVQDGFFSPAGQFGGMSGSAVVLEGTREVVGVAHRLISEQWQGRNVQAIVFTPIDALRELQERLP